MVVVNLHCRCFATYLEWQATWDCFKGLAWGVQGAALKADDSRDATRIVISHQRGKFMSDISGNSLSVASLISSFQT